MTDAATACPAGAHEAWAVTCACPVSLSEMLAAKLLDVSQVSMKTSFGTWTLW
jgi:hypothetical protein